MCLASLGRDENRNDRSPTSAHRESVACVGARRAQGRHQRRPRCVHYKTLDDLPLDVVGNTIVRVAVDQYVERYENSRTKKNPKTKTKKSKR